MKYNNKIKIYMIDDQRMFCDSLGLYFNLDNRFHYVGAGISEQEALTKVAKTDIDVILLDLKFGGNLRVGFEIAGKLLSNSLQKKAKIIFLSGYCYLEECRQKARLLNHSLLSKAQRIPELIEKIDRILTKDELIIDGESISLEDSKTKKNTRILKNTLTPSEGLTALSLYKIYVAEKKIPKNKEIAECRKIKVWSVATQLRDIYKKLKSVLELDIVDRYFLIQLLENSTIPTEFEEAKINLENNTPDWLEEKLRNDPKAIVKAAAKVIFNG